MVDAAMRHWGENRARKFQVAIIEPSELHWRQPGFTFVGSGVFTRAETERNEKDLIPRGVTWIKNAATKFLPDRNAVRLDDGSLVAYDFLVACLEAAIGRNGVCSNYLSQYAEYTWECIKAFRGGDALFMQPPCAPDFVASSPLANAAGWIDTDPATLRHVKYSNIFVLGDAGSTPNAKTAAAVRKQTPVVVENLFSAMRDAAPAQTYDGYGSCPLTVADGKIILAMFGYGGKVTPTFPLDPRKPRRIMWHLKTLHLPWLYWTHMFRGGKFDIPHMERRFT